MKKTLYSVLILILTLINAKSFAATLQISQVSKISITTDDDAGTGPGGNGSTKNGQTKTQ